MMELISCDSCGTVFDMDKLRFPKNIYNFNGEIEMNKAAWDGENYVAKIGCPVCQSDILEP
jgi:hypothetical protein